jgi:serine/threonine-protein kinase RsbW
MSAVRRFAADLKNLSDIRSFVQEQATALQVDPDMVADIILAVDESATNIIEHGYDGQPGEVEIEVRQEGKAMVICLRDQAPLFDPTHLPSPDVNLPLDKRPLGGVGVYLTRHMMDEVSYRVTPQGGNELTLVKRAIGLNPAQGEVP